MTDGDLSRFKDDPALLAELREAVLDELKMERVLRSLAKEYGISITNENWAEVDRSIEELEYRYQTGLGISLEDSVAQRYGTKDLLREMLAYGNYISDPVYDYIYNPKNGVIDRSDEAVRAYFDKYNCVLHVLLTKSGYETSANVEKTAKELYTIVTLACGSAEREDLVPAIGEVLSAYEEGKSRMSFIGRFSSYMARLSAVKDELSAEGSRRPAFAYLKTCADKLTGEDTPVTELKRLASSLNLSGAGEESKKDCEGVLTIYKEKIDDAVISCFAAETAYPSENEIEALRALEMVLAVLSDGTEEFARKTLDDAFSSAVRLFGEDKEDPEQGVFFLAGTTDEAFEKVYFDLPAGGIGGPVETKYGVHLLRRVEGSFEYFKEYIFEGCAVEELLDGCMEKLTVTFEPVYETITPETLK